MSTCMHDRSAESCEDCARLNRLWEKYDAAWDAAFARFYPARMTEQIEAGPHDWDETTRKCKRCGATTTDWQNHKADHCTTDVASPDYRPGAAADDYSTINRRLGEIEKENAVELAPVAWDFETDNLLVKATQHYEVSGAER